MTDPPVEKLNLLDTEYANILACCSYPAPKLQLLRLGVDPASARTTAKRKKSTASLADIEAILEIIEES
jgi:hypothetical protein